MDPKKINNTVSPTLTPLLDVTSRRTIKRLVPVPIAVRLKSTEGATAANYGTFFTADKTYNLVSANEVHGTKGTDGSAVSLQIEKLTGTTAAGSGTVLLSTAFNLKGTINTVQYGALVTTGATVLNSGDRLALKLTGTPTAVADLVATVFLETF